MSFAEAQRAAHGVACSCRVLHCQAVFVRMEFGREVFHDGLEPLDASRLAQGEKLLLFTCSGALVCGSKVPWLTETSVLKFPVQRREGRL